MPGTIVLDPGAEAHRAFIIEHGLVRVFWSTSDGRQVTVAFLHSREMLGAIGLMGRPPNASAQLVIETTVQELNVDVVRRLAATDVDVARAMATHLAAQARNGMRLVAVRSLGTIRERLAFDLLDRACRTQLATGRLEVRATHADLALSIGTSREVVTRTLRELRDSQIVETAQGVVRVGDAMRLAAIVRSFMT